MVRLIDNKLFGFARIIPLVFFTGISVYSYLPVFITIDNKLLHSLWFGNLTVFISSMLFILASFIFHRKTKVLIIGAGILCIIIGVFQVFDIYFNLPAILWGIISPLYIMLILITYNYDPKKLHRK